jgi:hypothetical protein
LLTDQETKILDREIAKWLAPQVVTPTNQGRAKIRIRPSVALDVLERRVRSNAVVDGEPS